MEIAGHAWLRTVNGEKLPVRGTCTIGRGPENSVVLPAEKVSRRHALIHAQNETEFWLVDLGSRNGTLRNSSRIKQPTRLQTGDKIDIGPIQFIFHIERSQASRDQAEPSLTETVVTKRATEVWLLVLDVADFTALCQRLSAEELPRKLGAWLLQCAEIVERAQGCVDKYVGDGFLAYWTVESAPPDKIVSVLRQLEAMRGNHSLEFRLVLHRANLHLGTSRFGNDSLIGEEINFVFRMEKLAGSLNVQRLFSAATTATLSNELNLRSLGEHSLKGFQQSYRFYTF